MKPLIHSNGNSRQSLINETKAAKHSINESINKVCELTVHMRNYYPLENGEEQYQLDLAEKRGMISKLEDIEEQLEKYWVHLIENA